MTPLPIPSDGLSNDITEAEANKLLEEHTRPGTNAPAGTVTNPVKDVTPRKEFQEKRKHSQEMKDAADVDNRFTYHPPHGDQAVRYGEIRERVRILAHALLAACPPSRERLTALTKLDEVVFFANAAIARSEKETPENG